MTLKVTEDKRHSTDMQYEYENLHSRPLVTPDSGIPENVLHLIHSFGYDCKRKMNLQVFDDRNIIFIAGNVLVLLDTFKKERKYLRSCSGGGIGCIAVHPDKKHFAVAEKGKQPNIIIYEYPSLQPQRVLRGGTEREYSCVDFNMDGSLLASIGNAPDFMLTIWDWELEQIKLRSNAVSQDAYRLNFSSFNPELLTSSGSGHINFWSIGSTFTGLKLQGNVGKFGTTASTDIEGFVELPDGKVLSGTTWGNLLLWDRSVITLEIGRKGGKNCHAGTAQPFFLDDGQLFTFGSDGAIRVWDFEKISEADTDSTSNKLSLHPLSEIIVGDNVSLSSIVKSPTPGSFMWFAQDSKGSIWKIDLSFSNKSDDPQCLFSCHAGMIQGMDVSNKAHLMATTSLDRSVRVYDFLNNRVLTKTSFNQGGTVLHWAPLSVSPNQSLLVVGFEDGVVRVLEVYKPERLTVLGKRPAKRDDLVRLERALKPHSAAVTAMAYDRDGKIFATGGADKIVFFLDVAENYNPMGFVRVPGAVQALEWSPITHPENKLLILCKNGHVVEVDCPTPDSRKITDTFLLSSLPRRAFKFSSIKSQIREKQARERREMEQQKEDGTEQQDMVEEEQKTESAAMPDTPSPLCCGFYSQPGQFWLSMGGYDSGFLYHCKFSENQVGDPNERQDEPFDFLPIENADDDPICSVACSTDGQLLFCGMHSGSVRVYPLQPDQDSITSMKAYWSLSVHDNDYGHLRHIRCSHDDHFVLTAGDDGNIFSFSLLPPEELKKVMEGKKAEIPLLKEDPENRVAARDIQDPKAHSIEMARQKLERDRVRQEADLKEAKKMKKLAEIQKKCNQVLTLNQGLPEHIRLKPEEVQLDPHFYDIMERVKTERLSEARRELAWDQEHSNAAFDKLQDWFKNSPEANVVTVVAIHTDHRVSTYHVPVLTKTSAQQRRFSSTEQIKDAPPEDTGPTGQLTDSSSLTDEEEVEELQPPVIRPKITLGSREEEKLRKAAEKAEQARKRIMKREEEWSQIYAEKPPKDYADPKDLQDIQDARDKLGEITLKSDANMQIDMKTMSAVKREELNALEEDVYKAQMDINGKITALRDSKDRLVSGLRSQAQLLQEVQQHLPVHLRQPPPTLPSMLPEETPEKWLQSKLDTLRRYQALRHERCEALNQDEWDTCQIPKLIEQIEKEMAEHEAKDAPLECVSPETLKKDEPEAHQLQDKIRLLSEQDSLIDKMNASMSEFDMELKLLRQQKLHLDCKIKLADLHKLLLVEELQILKQFEEKDRSLQAKYNGCTKKERIIRSELEKVKEKVELKQKEAGKLQDRLTALSAKFKLSLGEESAFEEFLIKVFKKNKKEEKKKQKADEQYSDDDSLEEDDWDDDDDLDSLEDLEEVDDSVCPQGCDQELFDYTLRLRGHRWNLEELLTEKKKSLSAVEMECNSLTKKEKQVKDCRKAAENDLARCHREIQDRLNNLDRVVPLRLHQIQLVVNDSMPSDLSEALVVHETLLGNLEERIKNLQEEIGHERKLHHQAKQDCTRMERGLTDVNAEVLALTKECDELMVTKFGKLVDVDGLEAQSGSRRLQELKLEKLNKEISNEEELKSWDAKVEQASVAWCGTIQQNSDTSRIMCGLLEKKNHIERGLYAQKKQLLTQKHTHYRRKETQKDIERLEKLVKTQSEEEELLRREIEFLSSEGGQSTAPGQTMPTLSLPGAEGVHPSTPPPE